MKRFLILLILLNSFLSIKAQQTLSGKYTSFISNNDTLPYNYTLNLNCDKTFVLKDSVVNYTATGTWKIKNNQQLILNAHLIVFKTKTFTGNKKVNYTIKNNELHETVITEKQYKKENKKLDKQVHACLPGSWEDYALFKAKQESRYLIKTDSFNCMQNKLASVDVIK